MEKRKRWQVFLIVSAIVLTVYNILPTVFFYTKPLKDPIHEKRAEMVAQTITKRVNALEAESVEWLESFVKLLELKPLSITLNSSQPHLVNLKFQSVSDAEKFCHFLPRAGNLISFVPAQLSLYRYEAATKDVTVSRRLPIHFDTDKIKTFFEFGKKRDETGQISDLYRALVYDRVIQLGVSLGGPSENALMIQAALANPNDPGSHELLFMTAQNIVSFVKDFTEISEVAHKYFATFSQINTADRSAFIHEFIAALERSKDTLRLEKISLQKDKNTSLINEQKISLIKSRESILSSAEAIVKRQVVIFSSGKTPWDYTTVGHAIRDSGTGPIQTISLQGQNPFIEEMIIDWGSDKITLQATSATDNQFIYNEIATAARQTGESILPSSGQFEITLSSIPDSQSFLALRLYHVAEAASREIGKAIQAGWSPTHPDLKKDVFPIWDYKTYEALPSDQKKLGLVIYTPSMQSQMPPLGMRMNSIYVVAKGVDRILQRIGTNPDSEASRQFIADFKALQELLQKNGFTGYASGTFAMSPEFASDFIFEGEDYYQNVVRATRENFSILGTKRYGVLEFSDVQQRLLVENRIDDQIHEELLKWRDDYHAAQYQLKGTSKYDIPAPTKNIFWNNFKLSFVKYFRGDDRKVLHWGLDMSGGKTVQIELRDKNNHLVTAEADIRQGINELYKRVNKMGVSEVNIRQEGNSIALDFPGSQSLSAAELVKASTMYFHVVNEKFMTNPALIEMTQRFLQDVWNEAVVTGRKEAEDLNRIAWRQLHGNSLNPDLSQPKSIAAKMLHDAGLRLANPDDVQTSSLLSESISKIAVFRGNDFTKWSGQTHPLMIVFNNFALEGSNLDNVHASYDPSKGNFLAFNVKGSLLPGQSSPRDSLYAWTSQFSKERVGGTPYEALSRGHGWRMAVILNGSIITAPTLESALRDSASITGSFTQREVTQLEADLKAGSLSFTPKILSEKNVSPELGAQERFYGIVATVLALSLVIFTMIAYYRFAGLVASIAVILNLLIMWAALQNIGATLTLAGIAGVILTVAMAVDANVLVFERIREEFAVSGRIASAIQAGYRKAFSAIIDSNITTIIAALVLLNFDSGPIRGFAVTLIIGIVSSLFTALFMTKFFFTFWSQNPEHKELKMMNLFTAKSFNFLRFTKPTIAVSALVILLGSALLVVGKGGVFGMDFTGGYALNIELPYEARGEYRARVEHALVASGASTQDFQVRELNPTNNIRIFLSHNMKLPSESHEKIAWIVGALDKEGIKLSHSSLESLPQNWTAISGQMSDTMRTNALIGLAIALGCILLYITIRFEFKYAISATICLLHDVLFCLGIIAILHRCGVSIQIDLHTVAALMTIVGYSLNDTIIVFDRIREDMKFMKKSSLTEVINHALNVTLSRTLMTSGITLLVLVPLAAMGGSTIFGFALVMVFGVIFGTLSSLFIAAPLMQYFHQRESRHVLEKPKTTLGLPEA